MDELELFETLRLGSARAWRALLDAHYAGLVRVARWYARDDEEARRLVREALAIALRGLDMFTWHGTFRSWLFGVLIDHARGSYHAAVVAAPSARVLAPLGPEAPAVHDLGDLPWTTWWQGDSWAAVLAHVAALSEGRREALGLVVEEGWQAVEAQDALGLTTAELERRRWYACDTLAAVLRRNLGSGATPADHEGIARLLAVAPRAAVAPPDRQLSTEFRRWRAVRGLTAWKRLTGRRRAPLRGGTAAAAV